MSIKVNFVHVHLLDILVVIHVCLRPLTKADATKLENCKCTAYQTVCGYEVLTHQMCSSGYL